MDSKIMILIENQTEKNFVVEFFSFHYFTRTI